jgi:hypothetical protein
MSEARINRISNEKGDGGPSLSGITTFSGLNYFVPPKGTTAERPSDCPPGSIRFNTDSAHLEYWDGLQWLEFEATNEEIGGVHDNNTGTGHRGLFASKLTPTNVNVIQYVTISTLGNTSDFGDLLQVTADVAGMGSRTRGVFAGGYGSHGNDISYVTFASTGDAAVFGSLSSNRRIGDARASSSTRGVMMGSMLFSPFGAGNNEILYITLASTGDAQDFGDLKDSNALGAGFGSPVRACVAGGGTPTNINTIQYITISTTGNAIDFGDLFDARRELAGLSNSTRGVVSGGYDGSVNTNAIQFVTIASTGNAQDFGDMSAVWSTHSGCSSPTRGLFGGIGPGSGQNIEYIEIASTGNAIDFGDFSQATGGSRNGSCSNGHGGL